jgi:hypothetical protein
MGNTRKNKQACLGNLLPELAEPRSRLQQHKEKGKPGGGGSDPQREERRKPGARRRASEEIGTGEKETRKRPIPSATPLKRNRAGGGAELRREKGKMAQKNLGAVRDRTQRWQKQRLKRIRREELRHSMDRDLALD